jgi:phosphoesterase RecJ-like protein
MTPSTSDIDHVVAVIRDNERFVVATHENPDGDALGSLLGLHLGLLALGKDSVMVLDADQTIPREYRFLGLEQAGLLRHAPGDVAERVLVAVDCAQESRIAAREVVAAVATVLNIDHHHDNTRFGDVDLVVADASSTGEVLADVLGRLGLTTPPPAVAEALYTAVVTDTGRFQYSNTTPAALRLAAELLEAGASSARVFRAVYESVEFPKLRLLGRALANATIHDGGRVVISHLSRADFAAAGVDEPASEGVIDYLRAVEGTVLVGLVRELPPGGARCKASLRSSSAALDVSAIARQSGGGGHRQAAGFSSELDVEGVRAFVLDAYARASAAA